MCEFYPVISLIITVLDVERVNSPPTSVQKNLAGLTRQTPSLRGGISLLLKTLHRAGRARKQCLPSQARAVATTA
jgi:hypothetical protein